MTDSNDTIWKPHVTVAAVIKREDKFLMVEEMSDGARAFNQPAGHLEPGEDLVSAMLRETLMEAMVNDGVDLMVRTQVAELIKEEDGTLTLVCDQGKRNEGFDQVIWAIGREPNT